MPGLVYRRSRRRAGTRAARIACGVGLLALSATGCYARDRLVGQPCEGEGDCVAGSTCAAVRRLADGSFAYECIELCLPENGYRCPGAELCWIARGDRLDLLGCFPGGDDPLGAPCTYVTNCERGLACEFDAPPDGSEPTEGTCVPGCEFGPCGEGEPCRYLSDCDASLYCAPVRRVGDAFASECVPGCEAPTDAFAGLCADGRACVGLFAAGPETGCVPGGDRPVGAPCEYAVDCIRGAICVTTAVGARECASACNVSADCSGGGVCVDAHCE